MLAHYQALGCCTRTPVSREIPEQRLRVARGLQQPKVFSARHSPQLAFNGKSQVSKSTPCPRRAVFLGCSRPWSVHASVQVELETEYIFVELPRPLGIVFAEKATKEVIIEELVEGGNAAASGQLQVGDKLDSCGPRKDKLVKYEDVGFEGCLDVLGGYPDSDSMVVCVKRVTRVEMDSEEDFSDTGAYWLKKRLAKTKGANELIRTGGLTPKNVSVQIPAIGEGSFGLVFRGVFEGRDVILKKANERVLGAVELLDVEMELNDLVSQGAPNAAAAYIGGVEVGEYEEGPLYEGRLSKGLWLVWEYEGLQTFGSLLTSANNKPKTFSAALGQNEDADDLALTQLVMRQVFECLASLHAVGVVHRDIKPDNFIVCEETSRLKLIDLGASAECLQYGLSYKAGEGPRDPKYCPPEETLLPDDAPKPIARKNSNNLEDLWEAYKPYKFDMYSAGVIFMQMSVKSLRSEAEIEQFKEQMAACQYDLMEWRKKQGINSDVLSVLDDAGWELATSLLQKEAEKRPSASEALAHPFFNSS